MSTSAARSSSFCWPGGTNKFKGKSKMKAQRSLKKIIVDYSPRVKKSITFNFTTNLSQEYSTTLSQSPSNSTN
jgi:lipocalin